MESLIFSFFYLTFIILWFYLLEYSGVKILTVSIPGIVIIVIIIIQYLGYPILFYFLNDYRSQFIQDRDIILKIFFISIYSITAIIIGFIFASNILRSFQLNTQLNYFKATVLLDKKFSRFILYLFFILSSLVLLNYINKIGLNNIALLSALDLIENSASTKVLRSNMGNAFEGDYHWYRLFMRDFLSITSVAFFGFCLLRKKLFYYFIFIISFIICSFSMTMSIEKAPIIKYLISLFLIYVLIRENGLFKIKNIAYLVFFVFLFLGFIYLNFTSSQNLLIGIKNAASRILTGEIHPMYHYLEIFPQQMDFVMGRSFPNPAGLMPYDPISISKDVYELTFSDRKTSGIVGSMPAYFVGEMYANFGYLGIIIPPFFIGFYLYWLNVLLVSFKNKTPIFLSIYIWIIFHYTGLATTSLSKFIIDFEMFIIILFFILIIALPRKMKLHYFKFTSIEKNK